MKVCGHCADTYQDPIEFCFRDGELLTALEGPAAVSPVQHEPTPGLALEHRIRPRPAVLRIGGIRAPVPTGAPEDRSGALMAGGVLGLLAVLVPLVGGGLVAYSFVVTSEPVTPVAPAPDPLREIDEPPTSVQEPYVPPTSEP